MPIDLLVQSGGLEESARARAEVTVTQPLDLLGEVEAAETAPAIESEAAEHEKGKKKKRIGSVTCTICF